MFGFWILAFAIRCPTFIIWSLELVISVRRSTFRVRSLCLSFIFRPLTFGVHLLAFRVWILVFDAWPFDFQTYNWLKNSWTCCNKDAELSKV